LFSAQLRLTIHSSRSRFVAALHQRVSRAARLNSGVRPLMKDLSIHISDDPLQFLSIAQEAQRVLGGEFKEQLNGPDQSYWDLDSCGGIVTVHCEHYLGVSLFCADNPASIQLLRRYAEATGRVAPLRPADNDNLGR
jgi:hypothetical protein